MRKIIAYSPFPKPFHFATFLQKSGDLLFLSEGFRVEDTLIGLMTKIPPWMIPWRKARQPSVQTQTAGATPSLFVFSQAPTHLRRAAEHFEQSCNRFISFLQRETSTGGSQRNRRPETYSSRFVNGVSMKKKH